MNIIGLGKAGCNISDMFNQYTQYNVFTLDTTENCSYRIPRQPSAELYDANPIDLSDMVSKMDDEDTYFILCGSGKIAACSLWILQQIKGKKVNIVYVDPEPSTVDQKGKLRNRAHYHVLQEYTRSGVFNKMFLFENALISDVIGKTSILNYFPKINQFIATAIHWMNIYNNTDTVFDTFRDEFVSSRICSFGVVNIETKQVTDTFLLEKCNQIKYFYGVNRIVIENDEDLLDNLNEITTSDTEDKSVSYGVYSTDLEQGFSFALKSSSEVQIKSE